MEMQKRVLASATVILVVLVLFFACKKNESEGSGVSPTYKGEATTTGANPYNPPASTT
jgi:hypothetical protein